MRPGGSDQGPHQHSVAAVTPFMARIRAVTSRRRESASAVYRPCLNAFPLPFGAPGDSPPCIRQRPFGIPGDRQGLPRRVRAPHRGLRCMGNLLCMGLFLQFCPIPTPGAATAPAGQVVSISDNLVALTDNVALLLLMETESTVTGEVMKTV